MANYGVDVPLKYLGNYRLGDIRHNYADLSKIKSLLGFVSKVGFKEGVSKFATWVNTCEIKTDRYR